MATQKKIGSINMSQVIRTIWLYEGISRIEISRTLGLDKSTITKIVNTLLGMGIVRNVSEGTAGPQGGRKPVKLAINRDFGYILGIEIQTDRYMAVVIDLQGKICFSYSNLINFSRRPLKKVFLEILQTITNRIEKTKLLGIVLGLPGLINSDKGIIHRSKPLNIIEDVYFLDSIIDLIEVPLLIENDANSCCWGELVFNRANISKNFIFVLGELREHQSSSIGKHVLAIGIGVVIDSKVHYGENFSAGEFQSVFREVTNTTQFSLPDNQFSRIEADQEIRKAVFQELSKNIALLVNVFNLSQVVFGGAIEEYKNEIIPILKDEIEKNWSYEYNTGCRISFSHHNAQSVAYGSACMFLEYLFSTPEELVDPIIHSLVPGMSILYHGILT
jgi:predicted NBD/HSP70 family sugar kinase